MDHFEEKHTVDIEHSNTEEKSGSLFIRIAVIVGIIIILFFVSVNIVKFVPKIFSYISGGASSIFAPKESVVLSTDKTEYVSPENVIVSWKNNAKNKEGIYSWSFKCEKGIMVEYKSTNGNKPVVCETEFPLGDKESFYSFKVISNNSTKTTLKMTLSFWDNTTKKLILSSSKEIVILPKGTPVNSPATTTETSSTNNSSRTSYGDISNGNEENNPPETTTPTPKQPTKPVVSGNPDLAISLSTVGTVDKYSLNFIQSYSANDNDKILVRFYVRNIGTGPSGAWNIKATLPTKIAYQRNFTSNTEPSFRAGQAYEFTLVFDNFDPSIKNIVITINNSNDRNLANNILTIPINYTGYNYNTNYSDYNYDYNYNNYYTNY